jgi:hypothetical protein
LLKIYKQIPFEKKYGVPTKVNEGCGDDQQKRLGLQRRCAGPGKQRKKINSGAGRSGIMAPSDR